MLTTDRKEKKENSILDKFSKNRFYLNQSFNLNLSFTVLRFCCKFFFFANGKERKRKVMQLLRKRI